MPKQGQSPETRSVEQYKVYTLHANVVKVLGKKDGKEITRTDRVHVAVFDNKQGLEKYQSKHTGKLKGQTGYEVVEDWTEVKPAASSFTLPFNPLPNAATDEVEATEDTNDNGTD